MLDYVRFPSDGDTRAAVYPGRTSVPRGELIADFVAYAQAPPRAARHPDLDRAVRALGDARHAASVRCRAGSRSTSTTSTPWRIPCSTAAASWGSPRPVAEPGETVFRTLVDFRAQIRGSTGAADPVDPGLELRSPKQVRPAGRGRPPPGRQGLPPLERLGAVHEGGARARRRRSRAPPLAARAAAGGASRAPSRS